MKLSTFLTTSTTFLATTTHASTVTLSTTKCLDPSYPLTQFSIALNTASAVPIHLETVCGLRIVSASDGIDVHTIQCQAFRDAVGTKPGSVVFTFDKPALIATNPVQEEAVKCSVVRADVQRRQVNGTASASASASVSVAPSATASIPVSVSVPLEASTSLNVVRSTLFSTQTVSASQTPLAPSTSVQIVTPSSSASSSSSSEQTSQAPSTTRLPPATQTNAAGKAAVGAGVLGAAFAVLVL